MITFDQGLAGAVRLLWIKVRTMMSKSGDGSAGADVAEVKG